jgi:hypothetical protein
VASGNAPAGTLCGAPQSCTDGVVTPAQACNANGICKTPAAITCGSGLCDGNNNCAPTPDAAFASP